MTTKKKPSLTDLKKELRKKTPNELIDEISYLYKNFSGVKEHYQSSFFNDDESVVKKYKAIIAKEFIWSGSSYSFPKARISVARKAISDYKKVSCSDQNLAELMIYYVECGVEFTNQFGDIDEGFYASMESMYDKALNFMKKKGIQAEFEYRAKSIVRNTSHIGWGFYDQLSDYYNEYFPDFN